MREFMREFDAMDFKRPLARWTDCGEPAILRRSMQSLSQAEIRTGLEKVNAWLAARETKGELCVYDGACLCLAFAARSSTKDVDAVFEPAAIVRKAAFEVAAEMGWSWNWLNDDVKGFLSIRDREGIELLESFELSHLKVYAANPEYLLAMKCLAARLGGARGRRCRDGLERRDLALPPPRHFQPRGDCGGGS